MIHAIEKRYEVPNSMFENKRRQPRLLSEADRAAIRACTLCDGSRLSQDNNSTIPRGRRSGQCTHDPTIELELGHILFS